MSWFAFLAFCTVATLCVCVRFSVQVVKVVAKCRHFDQMTSKVHIRASFFASQQPAASKFSFSSFSEYFHSPPPLLFCFKICSSCAKYVVALKPRNVIIFAKLRLLSSWYYSIHMWIYACMTSQFCMKLSFWWKHFFGFAQFLSYSCESVGFWSKIRL